MTALALDLGTTTLGGWLLDPAGGVRAAAGLPNPQAAFGADVVTRLQRAAEGEGRGLQASLVAGIEALLAELCAAAGIRRADIAAAAVAANPAITHFLLDRPVASLVAPPFRPREELAGLHDLRAAGLDLPVPAYLFPLVSGFVGGDLVAFLFGCAADPLPLLPRLFIDIGTNGELALWDGRVWRVTSVAAGPAFEGANLRCGLRFGPGAVTGVTVSGERFVLSVAGGGPPRGLCGSGLVAALAAARRAGLVDRHGTLADPAAIATNLARYLVATPSGRELRLHRDARRTLAVSQEEIRQFQLAKGALYAGVVCLLDQAGLAPDVVGEVVLTGAFGLSLAADDLKAVALLPGKMVEKVRFVEAGALLGLRRFLRLADGPERVAALARQLRPLPLSGTPAFERTFLASLDFQAANSARQD